MKKIYPDYRAAYPVIITYDPSEKNQPYLVHIVDFDNDTAGKTLPDAIEMARDAIAAVGLTYQDSSLPLPKPTLNLKVDDGFVSYVDIDLNKYRQLTDYRKVKKTITIPSYLNELGTQQEINFSQVMTETLKEKLGV
jgi:predicted RNase H-like HicB family nuclease